MSHISQMMEQDCSSRVHSYWRTTDSKLIFETAFFFLLVCAHLLFRRPRKIVFISFRLTNHPNKAPKSARLSCCVVGTLSNSTTWTRRKMLPPPWPYGRIIIHWQSILMRVHRVTLTLFWFHTKHTLRHN